MIFNSSLSLNSIWLFKHLYVLFEQLYGPFTPSTLLHMLILPLTGDIWSNKEKLKGYFRFFPLKILGLLTKIHGCTCTFFSPVNFWSEEVNSARARRSNGSGGIKMTAVYWLLEGEGNIFWRASCILDAFSIARTVFLHSSCTLK